MRDDVSQRDPESRPVPDGLPEDFRDLGDTELRALAVRFTRLPSDTSVEHIRCLQALHEHCVETLEARPAGRNDAWVARGELAFDLGQVGRRLRRECGLHGRTTEEYFADAVASIQASDEDSSQFEADAAIDLALAFYREHQPERAVGSLLDALESATIRPYGKQFIEVELAGYLIHQGNYAEALARLDPVIEGMRPRLRELKGRFGNSRSTEVEMTDQEANDLDLGARALGEFARAWAGSGEFSRAYEAFENELELARLLRDPWCALGAEVHRFEIWSGRGKWKRALSELNAFRASPMARELGTTELDVLGSMVSIARIESSEAGSPDSLAAIESLEQVVAQRDLPAAYALGARIAIAHAYSRAGLDELALDGCEVILDQLQLARASNEVDNDLPILDQALAMSTLTQILLELDAPGSRLRALHDRYAEVYRAFLRVWEATPSLRGGSGFLQHESRRRVLSDYIRLSRAIHGPSAAPKLALDAILRAQHLGTLTRRMALRRHGDGGLRAPEDALAFIEGAPEGHGFLIYAFGPDQSHLLLADRSGLALYELAEQSNIEARCKRAFAEMHPEPSNRVDPDGVREAYAALGALGQELIPDAARERIRRWSTTTAVGLEELSYSPIDLLPLDPARPRSGWSHPSSKLSSIELGVLLSEAPPTAGGGTPSSGGPPGPWVLRIVGVPCASPEIQDTYGELDELRFAPDDLDRIARPFEPSETQRLFGELATLEAVFDPSAPPPVATLIVAHGIRDPRSAFPAGFALGGEELDGAVFHEDVDGRAHSEVVIALTCRADSAPPIHGDGAANRLPGAFFAGGSQCVIAPQHDLEVDSTLELARILLEKLAAGDTPAQAVFAARRDLQASRPDLHPSLYAPVEVQGIGHRVVPKLRQPSRVPPGTEGASLGTPWPMVLSLVLAAALLLFGTRTRALRTPTSP